jgi:hypothetical protein
MGLKTISAAGRNVEFAIQISDWKIFLVTFLPTLRTYPWLLPNSQ